MRTITIRNLPDDLMDRLKEAAEAHHRSLEQEVRELLEQRYAPKEGVLDRVRGRWEGLPGITAAEVARWREGGRP